MDGIISKVMEEYLNDSKTLQNFIVGFCLLQSLSFLYSLDKLLNKIYKIKYLICLGLIIATAINIGILIFASCNELNIYKQIVHINNDPDVSFTIDLINKAKCLRITLVVLFNFLTLCVFIPSAIFHKPENTTIEPNT